MFSWLKKFFKYGELQIEEAAPQPGDSLYPLVPLADTPPSEILIKDTIMPVESERRIDQIIIHCSATRATQDIGVKTLRQWHTAPKPAGRGWLDVGYHYVIRRSGKVELGRDLDGDGLVDDEVGAHAFGWNSNSIGICLIGGVAQDGTTPEPNFTDAQMAALGALILAKTQQYPGARVMGHRDTGAKKACPSFDVGKWLAEYGLTT